MQEKTYVFWLHRGKAGSIVCLILGAFLLIPGLAAPRELPAPLFAAQLASPWELAACAVAGKV